MTEVLTEDLRFPEEPCFVHCIGGTGVGKSFLIKNVLLNELHTFGSRLHRVHYCYEFWQDKYSELQAALGDRVTFYKGFDGLEFFEKHGLMERDEHSPLEVLILDDQDERILSNKNSLAIFTQYLHHLKGVITTKEDEQTAAAKSDKDAEEEEEIKPLEASPNAETLIIFTRPVDTKDLPAGIMVKFLVGFYNKGDKDFIVETMEASFRYPMDYSFYIQNYTEATYNRVVLPGQEATFDYAFVPSDSYASRPFGLTVNLNYKDSDGEMYQNAVFNETVTIVEDESGFNPETGFLYLVFACIVILLLLLGQQFLSKMRRKHGMTKKQYTMPVELGTSNKNEVDFEWIPKEILNHANKSPRAGGSPGKSPRNRKAARRAGADD